MCRSSHKKLVEFKSLNLESYLLYFELILIGDKLLITQLHQFFSNVIHHSPDFFAGEVRFPRHHGGAFPPFCDGKDHSCCGQGFF